VGHRQVKPEGGVPAPGVVAEPGRPFQRGERGPVVARAEVGRPQRPPVGGELRCQVDGAAGPPGGTRRVAEGRLATVRDRTGASRLRAGPTPAADGPPARPPPDTGRRPAARSPPPRGVAPSRPATRRGPSVPCRGSGGCPARPASRSRGGTAPRNRGAGSPAG